MSTERIQQGCTLQATERLKLRKQIETLFQTGEAFSVFPLRIVYRLTPVTEPAESPVKAGFSVPKKRFKRAVQRNLIRRRLKEAWRLQKHPLYQAIPEGLQLHVFLVFTGPAILTFAEALPAVHKVMEKLAAKLGPKP